MSRDSQGPRSPPNEPIDYVLDILQDLKVRLNCHKNQAAGTGMLEKYDYFSRASNLGRLCSYAIKSKQLFLMDDFPEVIKMVENLVQFMRKLPGNEKFCK